MARLWLLLLPQDGADDGDDGVYDGVHDIDEMRGEEHCCGAVEVLQQLLSR